MNWGLCVCVDRERKRVRVGVSVGCVYNVRGGGYISRFIFGLYFEKIYSPKKKTRGGGFRVGCVHRNPCAYLYGCVWVWVGVCARGLPDPFFAQNFPYRFPP